MRGLTESRCGDEEANSRTVMKRKRVVVSKPTRDGCKTCRLRRIKCDETRPRCAKCTSSDRVCEYGVRVLPIASSGSSRALQPVQGSLAPERINYGRSLGILSPITPEGSGIFSFSDVDDRSAYDYFLKVVVGPIAATSPSQQWIKLALQNCNTKSVFHAMAAVGTAYRSSNRIYHSTLVHHMGSLDFGAAIRQYDKAVYALQEYIKSVVDQGAAVEPVLLASILLTCYEVMINHKAMALSHYRLGRRIVAQSVKTAKERGSYSSASQETIECLAAAFRTLGKGGEYYWNESERIAMDSSPIQNHMLKSIPLKFTSFIEADVHLETLVRSGQDIRNELVALALGKVSRMHGESISSTISFCLANCLARIIELPGSLQYRLDEISKAHLSWLDKLQAFSLQEPTTSNPIHLLTQIRYFASWLTISTCRETEEMLIDRFEPEFVRVLDLAEQYFRDVSGCPQPTPPPQMCVVVGLSLEGGLLPALHLIACKSRSSLIRRRAIKILCSANRQELTCHSGVIGSIVRFVADFEEKKAKALRGTAAPVIHNLTSDQVPEEARFADCVVKMTSTWDHSLQRPLFRLVCARVVNGQGGQIEVREYCGECSSQELELQSSRWFDCSRGGVGNVIAEGRQSI